MFYPPTDPHYVHARVILPALLPTSLVHVLPDHAISIASSYEFASVKTHRRAVLIEQRFPRFPSFFFPRKKGKARKTGNTSKVWI